MGVPLDDAAAASAIEDAFERARAGQGVEVRCRGGKGRTGTMFACMAQLAGVPGPDAIGWVRANYDRRAVERRSQHAWVDRFAARLATDGRG
jgi:protein-tyrosine phosphatase